GRAPAERQERLVVLEPRQPRAEARVVGEVLELERLAGLRPEGLVAHGEEEPATVARLVETIGRIVADQRRLGRIVDGAARLERQRAAGQRRLDALAAPRALAREERRENALGRERRRVVVGRRGPEVHGWAAEALERHQAAERLEDRIEAGTVGVGTGRAEGRDRGIDQARVDGAEALVAGAEPLGD